MRVGHNELAAGGRVGSLPVKKAKKWMDQNLPGADQGFTGVDYSGKDIEFEDVDDAEDLMSKLKKAGFKFKVDFREFQPNSSEVIYDHQSYNVTTIPMDHRIPCSGFLFREKPKIHGIKDLTGQFHQ